MLRIRPGPRPRPQNLIPDGKLKQVNRHPANHSETLPTKPTRRRWENPMPQRRREKADFLTQPDPDLDPEGEDQDDESDGESDDETVEEPPEPWEKLVITHRAGQVVIGVQTSDTDPYIQTFDAGGITEAIVHVDGVIAAATELWATQPRGKAYEPPPAPKSEKSQSRSGRQRRRKPSISEAPAADSAAPNPPEPSSHGSEAPAEALRLF